MRLPLDDVHKDAQNDGYLDGLNGLKSSKYEKYSSLQAAYLRGWEMGNEERFRAIREGR